MGPGSGALELTLMAPNVTSATRVFLGGRLEYLNGVEAIILDLPQIPVTLVPIPAVTIQYFLPYRGTHYPCISFLLVHKELTISNFQLKGITCCLKQLSLLNLIPSLRLYAFTRKHI